MHSLTPDSRWNFRCGAAAVAAGLLYGARWLWALSERQFDHMSHPPTWIAEWFPVVNLLLLAAVAGVYWLATGPRVRASLAIAATGLAWVSVTRSAETLGISAPWGFYSAPGFVAIVTGLLTAGAILSRAAQTQVSRLGSLLVAIALLRFGGGALSLLLFNLLERTDQANWVATIAGRSLHTLEALVWVLLGLTLMRDRKLRVATATLQPC